MGWEYIIYFVIALIIGFVMAPSVQAQPTPTIGEIKAPTAEEGREIPVLFGTRLIEGPNVVWYGDVRTVAVKKKGGKK